MEFTVKIGYTYFKFVNKNDAVLFAEIAKAHCIEKDTSVSVMVEWLTDPEPKHAADPEDLEDDEELREGQ